MRTYHPVPALQRTNGSLQDAPRLKGILKAALLEDESNSAPATPAEVLSRAVGVALYKNSTCTDNPLI